MIGKWENIKFGTIASFRNGLNFTKDSHGEGLKLIGVPDFQDYFKPIFESVGEISSIDTLKKDDYLKKGDILFVRSNGNKALVGRSLYINKNIPSVFSGFCIRARIFDKDSSSLFYAYFTRTKEFRALLSAASGGTNIQNLNQKILNNVLVPRPPIEMQQKIASILSAYDDLIENNLKRIKLLEEKAQLTYEEWFVRMKFPGHESVKIDKETGLPEGWEVKPIDSIIDFQNGFAFKSKRFKEDGYKVIKIKNIENNTINLENTNYIDQKYADEADRFRLEAGNLLIAMTGATVGKVGVVPETETPCYLNQRVGRFLKKGDIENTGFINCFFSIGKGIDHVLNYAKGAAQPNISGSQILSIKTLIPTSNLLKEFSNLSSQSTKFILNLQKQNQLLKEARDILLPRLMTGMIDVEKLDLEEIKEQPLGMVAEEKSKYETN